MARRGRPRKGGRRTKADKPIRTATIVKGNDRAEAIKSRYGIEGSDPLGRAYIAGLLGEGNRAKERLDMGRKFARVHRAVIPGHSYRCALDTSPRSVLTFQTPKQRDEEHWLRASLPLLDNALRPFFDQLVLPANPDNNPHWLESLLSSYKDHRDVMILDAALKALDSLLENSSQKHRASA